MHLEKLIIINRAPFENLQIDFEKEGINVLSGINGRGKTTILSHIADAFYELAKIGFPNEFEGKENKYYRVSSGLHVLNNKNPSLIYLRFSDNKETIDYLDARNSCSQEQYNKLITLENKIPYKDIETSFKNENNFKYIHKYDSDKIENIFDNNILTYFPSYRYEQPNYLNNDYAIKLSFTKNSFFTGYLKNHLEVISDFPQIANWIMDIVFDDLLYKNVTNKNTQELFKSINEILSKILFYKTKSQVRLGIGPRQYAGARIQVMKINNNNTDTQLYPSIFNMSSGEMVLTSMFCELLKQSDRLGKNFTTIEGIVLVDEVDKHLHIKLQKEVLPTLFNLFPKIQFIVSSHSPFFNFGLKNSNNKFKVFDLDNNGVQCLPLNNDLFNEVYEMFISENEQFAKLYKSLKKDLELSNIPLVITEGKTDWKHIQAAIKALNYKELKFEFLKYEDTMGDARLYQLLESAVKLNTKRKIIGIFDRDNQEILNKINTENNNYKQLGTNVFALIIPLVNKKIYGDQISIEHYYKKEELLKENNEKRRLFLGSEFYNSGMSKKNNYITKTKNIENKVRVNGIIDDKVYLMSDREQKNSVAMTKNDFADLILTEDEFAKDFDFSKFKKLLDEIKNICDL